MMGQIYKNVLPTLLTACFAVPWFVSADGIRPDADSIKLDKFQETVSGEPISLPLLRHLKNR